MRLHARILLAGFLVAGSAAFGAPAADKPATAADRRMLRDFSRCLGQESPGQARRILRLDYRTDEYRRSLRNLATTYRSCKSFSGSLKMSGVLLAGGLAEALLPQALAGQPLVARAAPDPALPTLVARDEGEFLGLCSVRTMPDRVAALLATAPASEEEKQAVAAISPNLAPCLKDGAVARLNRPGLRSVLALAAYRIVTQSERAPGPGAES